jgi:hypothetical protein
MLLESPERGEPEASLLSAVAAKDWNWSGANRDGAWLLVWPTALQFQLS